MQFRKTKALIAVIATLAAGCALGADAPPAPAPRETTPPKLKVDVGAVPAADPGSVLPANWQYGAFMEIYVRGYKDTDGDGIGDLKGVTQSLDYLKDLGISGIWLMPVTRSEDHDHGYATEDYRNIETDYGSLADLDELVAQAHKRGIGVILDYVMNHSAATHPLFENSRKAVGAYYRDWYIWSPNRPRGWTIYNNDPWREDDNGYYFAVFWGEMPDFNLRNPDVIKFHHDNLRFWLNRGVDGFRFDAVGNLVENSRSAWENQPENYAIMGDIRKLLDTYKQRFMVCEDPPDPIGFSAPTACGSAFAFGHNLDLIKAARGDSSAIKAVANYFPKAPATVATILANHDGFAGGRVYDQLTGNLAQYRLAAATYLLQPGIPFIFYGEEIGMAGATGFNGDQGLRPPMNWTPDATNAGFTTGTSFRKLSANVASFNVQAEKADPKSLLNFYKSLLALRQSLPSLARGSYENPQVQSRVMSFVRTLGDEHTLVVINYSGRTGTPTIEALPPGAKLVPRFPAEGEAVTVSAEGKATLTIPGQGVSVYRY